MKTRAILSWSSGKDSAWALHVLRQRDDYEIVGLLTTFNEVFDRVAMHGVRRELVEAQAESVGCPLWPVPLPWPCSNDVYEERMRAVIQRALNEGVTHVAFGDLFLKDIRTYREKQLEGTGIQPLFPIWLDSAETPRLAREMIDAGTQAYLTCVDGKQLERSFVGRQFGTELLCELPPAVDPCGENGEFHTFCHAGPAFAKPISVEIGEVVDREGFTFVDLRLLSP